MIFPLQELFIVQVTQVSGRGNVWISPAPAVTSLLVIDMNKYVKDQADNECYMVITNPISFTLTPKDLPEATINYYKYNPTKNIDCVWDIRVPRNARVSR